MTKRAFVFPGQGSQYIGMGKDFYDTFSTAREVFEKGNRVLEMNITDIIFGEDEEKLRSTEITQPALYLVSLAFYTVLKEKGLLPNIVAGHSLGEYAALTAAGVFDMETGLQLVKKRGKLIKEAADANQGGMIAILGLQTEKVEALTKKASESVSAFVGVANYNTPIQTVISYKGDDIVAEAISKIYIEEGAKRAVKLNVAGPFHSNLMDNASEKMKQELDKISLKKPIIPIVFNYNAKILATPEEIQDAMVKQINHPVQWINTINTMSSQDITSIVEVGAGKILYGLNKKINKELALMNVEKVADIEKIIK